MSRASDRPGQTNDVALAAVTTRLYLGPADAAGIWLDMVPVDSAADAVTVIMSGLSALLPPDRWEMAAEVLRRFGADEDHIAFQLRIARGDIAGLPLW